MGAHSDGAVQYQAKSTSYRQQSGKDSFSLLNVWWRHHWSRKQQTANRPCRISYLGLVHTMCRNMPFSALADNSFLHTLFTPQLYHVCISGQTHATWMHFSLQGKKKTTRDTNTVMWTGHIENKCFLCVLAETYIRKMHISIWYDPTQNSLFNSNLHVFMQGWCEWGLNH